MHALLGNNQRCSNKLKDKSKKKKTKETGSAHHWREMQTSTEKMVKGDHKMLLYGSMEKNQPGLEMHRIFQRSYKNTWRTEMNFTQVRKSLGLST